MYVCAPKITQEGCHSSPTLVSQCWRTGHSRAEQRKAANAYLVVAVGGLQALQGPGWTQGRFVRPVSKAIILVSTISFLLHFFFFLVDKGSMGQTCLGLTSHTVLGGSS